MKIALATDTHFGARSDSPQFNEFFFKFWENVFFPYLREHQIKTVVHLGDVVDRRKFINHYIADQFQTRFMRRLWEEQVDLHILVGNHDTYYKNTNRVNALHNLCLPYGSDPDRPFPKIYTDPCVLEFDGVPILMLPWICEDNYSRALECIREAPVSLAMGHLEIAGFEMDKGLMCTEGMDASVFDRFELVMTGHFHHRSKRGPIQYLGNTYEMTWSDYADERGFHVFDTETRQLTFIPNPYRMFYKLHYNDAEQDFHYWNEVDYASYKDTCVKIVVHQKQNPYLFDTMLDKLYASSPLDISIVENYLPVAEDASFDPNTIDQAEDTMTILFKYIDGLKLNIDGTQLKEFMNQLYQETLAEERAL